MNRRLTYDDVVKKNLDTCFDSSGNFIEDNYQDPDNYSITTEKCLPKIILADKTNDVVVDIKVSSDGLISCKKFLNFSFSNLTDKNLYFIFRHGMEKCLQWPIRTWSINQARRSCGNDDRLDLLLVRIQTFYEICNNNMNIGLCPKFINEVYSECGKVALAFLNMPALIWLCCYENFNDFIEKRNLKAFVNRDNSGFYHAVEWANYYDELLVRTKKYRDNNNMQSFEEYLKEQSYPANHK